MPRPELYNTVISELEKRGKQWSVEVDRWYKIIQDIQTDWKEPEKDLTIPSMWAFKMQAKQNANKYEDAGAKQA